MIDYEVWRPVVGYEGMYSVSNLGRVRRDGGGVQGAKVGRILKLWTSGSRHLRCYLSQGGNQQKFAVHRLVCGAFHGPCPPGMECRHLDGNPQNNRAEIHGLNPQRVGRIVRREIWKR